MSRRLLVIWGKYDLSFDLSEPEAYSPGCTERSGSRSRGRPFALDTAADEIAALVQGFVGSSHRAFLARHVG
jgi:hypothetical protein